MEPELKQFFILIREQFDEEINSKAFFGNVARGETDPEITSLEKSRNSNDKKAKQLFLSMKVELFLKKKIAKHFLK